MKSVAEALSDQNRPLLKVIRATTPDSMAMRAKATGRQPGNLSGPLKTSSRDRLVELLREKTHVRPVVKVTEFRTLAAASCLPIATQAQADKATINALEGDFDFVDANAGTILPDQIPSKDCKKLYVLDVCVTQASSRRCTSWTP